MVHEGGEYRVERGGAAERPGCDQGSLDTRHDDFGEFARARATHSEDGELESQAFDDDGERLVMINRTPPANFSFASGVSAPEAVAEETRARAGAASTFTKPELIDAVTELFTANDWTRIVPMLAETFVLKIPETLPYGGSFQGPGEFERFFQRIYDNQNYWFSFHTELALGRVLDAGTHLVAPLRVTAVAKSSGATITVENLWLFEIADGRFVRAQLYADTAAAGRNTAG